jgi:hypothetical protein
MMKLIKLFSFLFKSDHLGVTIKASKNIMGTPGGGIKEGAYWVYQK